MRVLREHLLVILFFLVITFLFTLPFSVHVHDHILAIPVDNLLNAYIMAWDAHALLTNPFALFHANINYPSRDALAFSEHLFTLGLLSLPLQVLTGNAILAHNLILLLGFALCGYTMYLLAKYLTRNRLAALAAGFFFAFVPYHFSTIVHAHVTLYFFQPLVVFFLIRYFEEGGKRNLLGFGLSFLAQALLSWYQLAFSTLPVALILAWRLLSVRRLRHLAAIFKVAAVLLLCLLLVVPFALPYLRLRRNVLESESSPAENPVVEARPADFLRTIDENLLYNNLGILNKGHIGEGNALFPGFVIMPFILLAILALFLGKRGIGILAPQKAGSREGAEESGGSWPNRSSSDRGAGDQEWRKAPGSYVVFFLVLAALCFLLSLGRRLMGHENSLFRVLHKLPIYTLVRFPIRYHIVVLLSLSVLAAYGLAYIHRLLEIRGRSLAAFGTAAVVITLLFIEFSVSLTPFEPVPVGERVPQAYRDLADLEPGVLLEAPTPALVNFRNYEDPLVMDYGTFENALAAAFHEQAAVYLSTYHWHKMVNGMSGYYPIFYRRALAEMLSFPGSRSLTFLRAMGVRYLLVHWEYYREYYPEGEDDRVREILRSAEGVELVRDYPPDLTLYALRGLEAAPPFALETRMMLPEKVLPGTRFHASLEIANTSSSPFVNTEEYRHHLMLSWSDGVGRVVKSEETFYYFPFFLPPGEETAAVLRAESPPVAGDYELSALALDGPLRGQEWRGRVVVTSDQVAEGENDYAGTVYLDMEGLARRAYAKEGLQGRTAAPVLRLRAGELFSLPVEVANLGRAVWVRDYEDEAGRVEVTAFWDEEGPSDESLVQHGMLPCDLSPGQRANFSVSLMAPRKKGIYYLNLLLNRICYDPIGDPVTIRVEVL